MKLVRNCIIPQTEACLYGVLAVNLFNWLWQLRFGKFREVCVHKEFSNAVRILELIASRILL